MRVSFFSFGLKYEPNLKRKLVTFRFKATSFWTLPLNGYHPPTHLLQINSNRSDSYFVTRVLGKPEPEAGVSGGDGKCVGFVFRLKLMSSLSVLFGLLVFLFLFFLEFFCSSQLLLGSAKVGLEHCAVGPGPSISLSCPAVSYLLTLSIRLRLHEDTLSHCNTSHQHLISSSLLLLFCSQDIRWSGAFLKRALLLNVYQIKFLSTFFEFLLKIRQSAARYVQSYPTSYSRRFLDILCLTSHQKWEGVFFLLVFFFCIIISLKAHLLLHHLDHFKKKPRRKSPKTDDSVR